MDINNSLSKEIEEYLNDLDPNPGEVEKQYLSLVPQQVKLKICLESNCKKINLQIILQEGATQTSKDLESFCFKQETYQSTGLNTKPNKCLSFSKKLNPNCNEKNLNYPVLEDNQDQFSQFEKILNQQESENALKQLQQQYGIFQESDNRREINQMYQLNRKIKNISKYSQNLKNDKNLKNSSSMNQLGAIEIISLKQSKQYSSKRSNYHQTSKQVKSILKRTSFDSNTKSEGYTKRVRFSLSLRRPRMCNLD